ncbi:hypothetical protein [Streptomyces sp. CAU 1734]|uniref:hypothetical protein n=1 Tax=Streptomyces sp. CAU 1734 TaxID=3140360 RepID=UPI003260FAE6
MTALRLTDGQIRILQYAADGFTDEQIARRLRTDLAAVTCSGPACPPDAVPDIRPTRTCQELPMTEPFPTVQGRCPACRGTSLFLGTGGHVTCAADELLHGTPVTGLAATEATGFRARLRQQLAEAQRAAREQPVERCGNQTRLPITDRHTECALRPGHSGSHADDRGARWWLAADADRAQEATTGELS